MAPQFFPGLVQIITIVCASRDRQIAALPANVVPTRARIGNQESLPSVSRRPTHTLTTRLSSFRAFDRYQDTSLEPSLPDQSAHARVRCRWIFPRRAELR